MPRLRTQSLAADVRRLAVLAPGAGRPPSPGAMAGRVAPGDDACARPSVGPGQRRLPVLLDDRRATVVLPAAGPGRVRVYTCRDASTPVATVVVP